MSLLVFIIIGILAGWVASLLARGGGMGIIGDFVVGVAGSIIGGYILDWFGIYRGHGFWGSVLTAIIGAVVLLFVIKLVKKI